MTKLTEIQRREALTKVKAGHVLADVAKSYGVHYKTLQRAIDRYDLTGSYKDRPHTGRPPKLTPRDKKMAVGSILFGEVSSVSELKRTLYPNVSENTLRACLHQAGLKCHRGENKPWSLG